MRTFNQLLFLFIATAILASVMVASHTVVFVILSFVVLVLVKVSFVVFVYWLMMCDNSCEKDFMTLL